MSWFERFLKTVCRQRHRLVPMVVVLSLMGVLLAISFPFLEPGTTARSLALLDLAVVVICFGTIIGTYWYCSKWTMNRGFVEEIKE